mmetsp:Transcript_30063/g.26645  ORF Transcript_30063/g.26645 Transcript_30063/m.26645 type:complete len:134 (+) Transcript_30063:35-436(+)
MISSDNHYIVLGLQKSCNGTDIKKAYHRLAMEYHPDKNQDKNSYTDSEFKKVKKAYDVLSDLKLKKKFDDREVLNNKYSEFVDKNRNLVYEKSVEDAFSQLIKGKYPDAKDKRLAKEEDKVENKEEEVKERKN